MTFIDGVAADQPCRTRNSVDHATLYDCFETAFTSSSPSADAVDVGWRSHARVVGFRSTLHWPGGLSLSTKLVYHVGIFRRYVDLGVLDYDKKLWACISRSTRR